MTTARPQSGQLLRTRGSAFQLRAFWGRHAMAFALVFRFGHAGPNSQSAFIAERRGVSAVPLGNMNYDAISPRAGTGTVYGE